MHIPLAAIFDKVPTAAGERSAQLFEHGTLRVKIYAPRGNDAQTPHKQDELYVIARGSGEFVIDEPKQRFRFTAGDLLFVRAGVGHRFKNFSDDFYTWVIFYGPQGGER